MKILIAVLVAASLASPLAFAQEHKGHGSPAAAQGANVLADGEVRKVDKDAQKLTIRHGALPQLDMPQPMTMVYRVKDPGMLERVKPGQKIRFSAEKVGGAFTVVHIEPAR